MTLNEWRLERGLSYRKLASLMDSPHATVARRWCLPAEHKDQMIPSPAKMLAIYRLTDGSVQPNDFYLSETTIREISKASMFEPQAELNLELES